MLGLSRDQLASWYSLFRGIEWDRLSPNASSGRDVCALADQPCPRIGDGLLRGLTAN